MRITTAVATTMEREREREGGKEEDPTRVC